MDNFKIDVQTLKWMKYYQIGFHLFSAKKYGHVY